MKKILSIIVASLMLFTIAASTLKVANAKTDKVTICHATSSVTNPYERIYVSENAINGHFDNPGTPKAGHEKDILLEGDVACPVTPEKIEPLKLTSMCSIDPESTRRWRVRNPNPWDIAFTWEVYSNVQTGNGIAIGNSDTFFETNTIAGPNTVKIYWQDNGQTKSTTKASGGERCEVQELTVSGVCSDLTGLTRWNVHNPNYFSVRVHFHVTPGDEENSFDVAGNSDKIFETATPGEIEVTIYWDGGHEHSDFDCANNKNLQVCPTPPPPPPPLSGGTKGTPKIKISPQVLGTTAPSAQPLPVTGADVNYSWIYYFLIIASLSFTYYMKAAGWKKFSR